MKKTFSDSFLFGLITGLIIQVLAFFLILFLNKSLIGYTERSVFEFLDYLMGFAEGKSHIIPKLLSLAAISDLLLFFIYLWTNWLKSARGVIGSAFILGTLILLLKFI